MAKRTHTEKGENREMITPPELVPMNLLTFKQPRHGMTLPVCGRRDTKQEVYQKVCPVCYI